MPEPKGLALIIGGGKGKPSAGGEGDMSEEDMTPDAGVEAMRRFREAFESGDDAAAYAAFKDAYSACSMGEEEPEDEEMPEMPMGEEE